MAETKKLIKERRLEYEGIFNLKDLFDLVMMWVSDNGYDILNRHTTEQALTSGKTSKLILELHRKVSDYIKLTMKLECEVKNCKEVVIEKDSYSVKSNQGNVLILITSGIETDYEKIWDEGANRIFIRELFDRFVYNLSISNSEKKMINETDDLTKHIKSFLNMY